MAKKHSPNARILLLNSPMVSEDVNIIFVRCLKEMIQSFKIENEHNNNCFI